MGGGAGGGGAALTPARAQAHHTPGATMPPWRITTMALTGFHSIARAFLDGKAKRLKNDNTDGYRLMYHGNTIAIHAGQGRIQATLAGWDTVTTRARVNQLARMMGSGLRIERSKGECLIWDRMAQTRTPLADSEWINL